MIGVKDEVSSCNVSDDLIHMNSKEITLSHSLNSYEMCMILSCPSSQESALHRDCAVKTSGLRQEDQYYRSLKKSGCVYVCNTT